MGDNGFAENITAIADNMQNTQRLLREATVELNRRQRLIEDYRRNDARHEWLVGKLLVLLKEDDLDGARDLVQSEYDAVHGPND